MSFAGNFISKLFPLQMFFLVVQSGCFKYCISNGEYNGKNVTASEICPDELGCIEADKNQTMLSFWDKGKMSVCSSFQILSECKKHCKGRC